MYRDWHTGPTNAWTALYPKCFDQGVLVEPSDVHSWGDVASSRYIGRTEYLIRHRRRYRTGLRRRLVTRKIDPSTAPVAASEALSSSTSQPLSFST